MRYSIYNPSEAWIQLWTECQSCLCTPIFFIFLLFFPLSFIHLSSQCCYFTVAFLGEFQESVSQVQHTCSTPRTPDTNFMSTDTTWQLKTHNVNPASINSGDDIRFHSYLHALLLVVCSWGKYQ